MRRGAVRGPPRSGSIGADGLPGMPATVVAATCTAAAPGSGSTSSARIASARTAGRTGGSNGGAHAEHGEGDQPGARAGGSVCGAAVRARLPAGRPDAVRAARACRLLADGAGSVRPTIGPDGQDPQHVG